MKYRKEYLGTKTKEAFTKAVLKNFKDIKPETATRRWYDLRKKFGNQEDIKKITSILTREEIRENLSPIRIDSNEIPTREPNQLRLLEYLDMKKFKQKTTRKYLSGKGFSEGELNWLEERNMIESEEV